jgi:hypothetical protein
MGNTVTLRPIGTEFWYAYPLSFNDHAYQKRFLYRVIGHSKTKVGMAEELKPIRMQQRPMLGFTSVELSDRFVPNYIFGEWEDVA